MRGFASLQTNPWLRRRAAECCLALALGPAFAWISPFGTQTRLGYWIGLFACWFVMVAIIEKLLDATGVLRRLEPLARGAAMVGVAALPMMLIVGPATHALTGWEVSLSEVVELYFQIVVIGSGVTLIASAALASRFDASTRAVAYAPSCAPSPEVHIGAAEVTAEPTASQQELPAAANRLVGRLPQNLRGRILGLEMEDHYVRVHTDRGSALVLLRLSDAIAAATPTPGRQVHRSWWVADDAIEHFERVGRAGQIRLSNGLTAPVSQRYLKELDQLLSQRDQVRASTPAR